MYTTLDSSAECDGEVDAADYPSLQVADCEVLTDAWPPLLSDLVALWGLSVGVDPLTAAALILDVAGGIAGNTVRLNVPYVGEIGCNLQLAVVRDQVPALRRGLLRLTAAFEDRIIALLQVYEHLTDLRSQRNELAALETRYNPMLARWKELQTTLNNERAMVNAFCQQEEAQILNEHERLCASIQVLGGKLRALRFQMKPMVMVPELSASTLDELDRHGFDRAILEVATSPGYFHRQTWLNEKALERLSAFRRNAEWASRLDYVGGRYQPRSAISTVLLVEQQEFGDAMSDPLLARSGIFDEMLVRLPTEQHFRIEGRPDPAGKWSELVSKLMGARLDRIGRTYSLDDSAREEFLKVRAAQLERGMKADGAMIRLWREGGPALVGKLALAVALFREGSEKAVRGNDVRIAAWIANGLLESTSQHWAASRGASPIAELTSVKGAKTPDDDPVAAMVRKVRKLQPCSIRTLFRTYSSQDYAQLAPVLERAIELGLIERDGKVLKAPSLAHETVSVSPSACQQKN
ncbi:hypothetical protein [Luteolibacter sp. LG18]|uniref:hypothetical protein n=1 Tax=Luteolibacter sp. LG18 TaxID=2819286 RepID=UPI002B2E0F07|nr:hypothetical protein llg_15620 [Luteolibacter sp. LG18]